MLSEKKRETFKNSRQEKKEFRLEPECEKQIVNIDRLENGFGSSDGYYEKKRFKLSPVHAPLSW